jgi:hypothetical protein
MSEATRQPLFMQINVWRKISETQALRYNCLQDIETGQFRVATCDFVTPENESGNPQFRYFVEQTLADDPEDPEDPEPFQWFSSLQAAIADHDIEFDDV